MDDNNENVGTFPAPSPSRCIYGYVLFLLSLVGLIVYQMWAFIPTRFIQQTGITYISSKYWAIALPVYFLLLIVLFALFLYPAVNLLFTPPLNHYSTVCDMHYRKNDPRVSSPSCIPPISDLPLDFVCKQLYSK